MLFGTATPAGENSNVNQSQGYNAKTDEAFFNEDCHFSQEDYDNIDEAFDDLDDEQAQGAKSFFKSFMDFVNDSTFRDSCEDASKRYGVPPQTVAKNFVTKVLTTVGSIIGRTISTIGNIAQTFISVVCAIARGAVDLIVKAGNVFAGFVSMGNYQAA